MAVHSIRDTNLYPDADYSSISAFIAGEQCDLTALGEPVIGELYDDWSENGLDDIFSVTGFTNPTEDYYVEIRAAEGHEHNLVIDSGARVNHYGGNVGVLGVPYSKLTLLQIKQTQPTYGITRCVLANALNCAVSDCIAIQTYSNTGGTCIGAIGAKYSSFINNLSIDANQYGFWIYSDSLDGAALKHNIAYNCDRGYSQQYNSAGADPKIQFYHNVAYNCDSPWESNFANGIFTVWDYNASESGGSGAHPVNLTTDPFTDAANGDFTYTSTSELIDSGGTSGCGVTEDCIGTDRPQNTYYDLGWFEFVSSTQSPINDTGVIIQVDVTPLPGAGSAITNDIGGLVLVNAIPLAESQSGIVFDAGSIIPINVISLPGSEIAQEDDSGGLTPVSVSILASSEIAATIDSASLINIYGQPIAAIETMVITDLAELTIVSATTLTAVSTTGQEISAIFGRPVLVPVFQSTPKINPLFQGTPKIRRKS